MINGVRVRDSGVELSPTGTDRRGGPGTASNRTVRASSAIAAGSTRGSCGGPNGHFRPLRRTGPPMATHGHLWPPLYSRGAAQEQSGARIFGAETWGGRPAPGPWLHEVVFALPPGKWYLSARTRFPSFSSLRYHLHASRGVGDSIIDRVTGHATPGETSRYTKGSDLRQLQQAIEAIAPRVDLAWLRLA
jgi:hypothetical protein